MGVRRFVNELLLVSPVLFIASITVQARTRTDSFEPVECSPTMQQRIAAYSEPVRLVEEALDSGITVASPNRLRQIGETWRNMTRQGTLTPLRPEHKEDTCRDGVKAQVRIAADMLAAGLQFCAHSEVEKGNMYQAAQDALLAMEATQGIRFSDLYTVGSFAARDNVSLKILDQAGSALTDEEKRDVLDRLRRIREDAQPLAEIVVAMGRANRKGIPSAGIAPSDFDLALRLAAHVDRMDPESEFDALYRKLARGIGRANTDEFLPDFRYALNATRNFQKNCAQLAVKFG